MADNIRDRHREIFRLATIADEPREPAPEHATRSDARAFFAVEKRIHGSIRNAPKDNPLQGD